MNTNKTYIAFDATGVADHENSDLPIFQQLRQWERQNPGRYHFVNMEDIDFSSEHVDWVDSTLKVGFLRKMEQADNLLIISSKVLNAESPILSWQISKAANRFRLPIIIAYAGFDKLDDEIVKRRFDSLPNKIRKYIRTDTARMAHIPLTKDKLERALGAFSVKDGTYPWHTTTVY